MSSSFGKKRIKWIIIIAVLAVLAILWFSVSKAQEEAATDRLFTFEGNAERVAFINSKGFIVEPDPEKEDITIPPQFNDAFTRYNQLQESQGFDLLPYAGVQVQKYTYKILNYPDHPDNMVVNLIFDDHLLIAADVTCNDADNGFTKALLSETIQETVG